MPDAVMTDAHTAEAARVGWAARDAYWHATGRRRPTSSALEESGYRITPAEGYREGGPQLDWRAVEADERKYWTSLAICAEAARQLAQVWAAPTPFAGGAAPGVQINERELFGLLVSSLVDDSAAAAVCRELQLLGDAPSWAEQRELAADCLDVAPYPPTHPLAPGAGRAVRAVLNLAAAERLAQLAEDVL